MGSGPDALSAAIARAWRVFDLPAPATTGVCEHCCMDPAIEARFLTVPARDLPLAYVRDWYDAAYSDGITRDHVAWFLPRVFELLAEGQDVAPVGNEVALGRLPLTGFPDGWPNDEVAAVLEVCQALFQRFFEGAGKGLPFVLDDMLCMFSKGGMAVEPYLAMMEAMPEEDLIALLHHDWIITRADGLKTCHIWTSAFWDDLRAREVVQAWYVSPGMFNRLERGLAAGNPQAQDILGGMTAP